MENYKIKIPNFKPENFLKNISSFLSQRSWWWKKERKNTFLTPMRECIRIYFKTFCFLRKHRNPRIELKQISWKQEPAGTSFRSFYCCIAPHLQTVVLSRGSGCLMLWCKALIAASVNSPVRCRHHNGFLARNIPHSTVMFQRPS